MTKFRVFLDGNGTSPLREPVREAMIEAMKVGGNPSSVHAEGRAARALVDEARVQLSRSFAIPSDQITFTSGGSEANRLVLQPGLLSQNKKPVTHLLCSAVEHPSVLFGGDFAPSAIDLIPLDSGGSIDLRWLEVRLAELAERDEYALVSVMAANNETGIIHPIKDISALCQRYNHRYHCDAAQAIGRMVLDDILTAADFITVTAHKAGGPVGVGALLAMKPDLTLPKPVIGGGGQERGLRAGTENVAAIAGFAALLSTLEETLSDEIGAMRAHQQKLEKALLSLGSQGQVIGQDFERLPNTTAFWWPDIQADVMLMKLDWAGLAVSSGSACSSGKVSESHVLKAMGYAPASALRFSSSWATDDKDLDKAIDILSKSWG